MTAWGAYLENARRRKGWTVQQLADAAGAGRSTIHDWISNGGSEKISVERIVRIARAVGDDPVRTFVAAADLVEEHPDDREIGQIIKNPHLTDAEKQREIDRVRREREQDTLRRMERTEQLLSIIEERQAS